MKLQLYLLTVATLLLASCSRSYYAPALFNNDVSYMAKPASFDSSRNAVYVSGGAGFGQGADGANDAVGFGTLDISAGHTFKGANLAYGVFGFAGSIGGSYSDNTNSGNTYNNPNRLTSAGFYGAGARFSGNLYKRIGNADFRFIGLEAVYSKELGDYAAFRKQVFGRNDVYSYTNTRLFTAGLTSEVIWHSHNHLDHQYGFRGFAGRTFGSYNRPLDNEYDGDTQLLQTVYLSASYFMQIKKIFGTAELSATPSGLYWFPEFRIRIGYRF